MKIKVAGFEEHVQLSDFYCTKDESNALSRTFAYTFIEGMGHAAEAGIVLA
ncbi:MAG TPA: hypothetical protein VM911_03620 [Pyrinomonadaceae bacterium]|nr:hypothetical protein [Pyrinomonadaceae bacterium]